ncbi:MAG: aminotransferase class V-fold PLP-dependent enzyme [Gammaproteobacteria bacterium]|nr:aminotransferase class V-fold PLP-dependent enzyme [Gammaproteobacteria bacterium]
MSNKKLLLQTGSQTKAVHAGERPDSGTGASAPNIVMSSTFVVDETVSFSALNLDEDTPYMYSRWSNPTVTQLEDKLTALEEAEACVAFASGMAASTAVLLSFLSHGDHLVISSTNYLGTAELARKTLPRMGISVTPVDTSNPAAIESAIKKNTRMVWLETPSNPLINITDIAKAAQIAHSNHSLLAVDSTFATPIATKPLSLGADLVIHSLTKYIGGHGDAMGGAVLGNREHIAHLHNEGVIHHGGVISPFNAWLIMRGTATLPIRMRVHQENAQIIAEYLEGHDSVELVRYPGLKTHPDHDIATKQMSNFSGMLAFRVNDPHAVARKMMKKLEIFHYAVSLGHHRSLIYLMETKDLVTSSYELTGFDLDRYRRIAGSGLFRVSIGLENHEDLIKDLDQIL